MFIITSPGYIIIFFEIADVIFVNKYYFYNY